MLLAGFAEAKNQCLSVKNQQREREKTNPIFGLLPDHESGNQDKMKCIGFTAKSYSPNST